MSNDHPIKFAAIGLAHNHVYDISRRLVAAGAELVACWDDEPGNLAAFAAAFPHAATTHGLDELLRDEAIALIVSAAIHDERAALGVRAMQRGKDFLCTKPGLTTLEQLDAVRNACTTTGCKYTVYFGERVGNPATVLAGELVRGGAIGRVVHTAGFGPHRLFGRVERPAWVFQRTRYGGVLNDLASHQIDQFLHFTGSASVEIVAATVANHHHPQFAEFEDFGELLLRGEGATGFIRVDWLSPAGLDTWGDVRLFLLGTEGYIEVRKTWDVQGRAGTNHLFVVDGKGERHMQATGTPLPFIADYLSDLRQRTETAITQAHVLLVSELALRAQAQAHFLPASQ